jgi:hypothetical protein
VLSRPHTARGAQVFGPGRSKKGYELNHTNQYSWRHFSPNMPIELRERT